MLFNGITVRDTIAPLILSTIPRNGSTISTLYPEITILFSEIILQDNFHVSFIEVETGRKIEPVILKNDSDEYRIKPKESLVNYSSYRCLINVLDAENNEIERDYELNFIPIIR
ncbi:MAG: Ig-like domain-containing protein [Candidatus Cloacimonetes bacterium]|nr:Ig-like domain-containing protein [Candidatus Cloacimonadota bacterium]